MLFGKSRLELKVGIFVFVGMIILATFILFIGNFKTWSFGYYIDVVYNFVNGVKLGAPVRFAGVDVGEVKGIKFFTAPEQGNTKIRITCWLSQDVKIPVDSTVWVNTLGLMGEKYIEIMPGKNHSQYLADGQELKGEDPLPMQEIGEMAKAIAKNLDDTLFAIRNKQGTVGRFLSDDSVYIEIESLVKQLEGLVADIRSNPWKLFWKSKEKPPKK